MSLVNLIACFKSNLYVSDQITKMVPVVILIWIVKFPYQNLQIKSKIESHCFKSNLYIFTRITKTVHIADLWICPSLMLPWWFSGGIVSPPLGWCSSSIVAFHCAWWVDYQACGIYQYCHV